MLLATQLKRKFTFKSKAGNVPLEDPNPTWSTEAVLNFYSGTYPELTTCKVSGPEIKGDSVEYNFETVMGTKG